MLQRKGEWISSQQWLELINSNISGGYRFTNGKSLSRQINTLRSQPFNRIIEKSKKPCDDRGVKRCISYWRLVK